MGNFWWKLTENFEKFCSSNISVASIILIRLSLKTDRSVASFAQHCPKIEYTPSPKWPKKQHKSQTLDDASLSKAAALFAKIPIKILFIPVVVTRINHAILLFYMVQLRTITTPLPAQKDYPTGLKKEKKRTAEKRKVIKIFSPIYSLHTKSYLLGDRPDTWDLPHFFLSTSLVRKTDVNTKKKIYRL